MFVKYIHHILERGKRKDIEFLEEQNLTQEQIDFVLAHYKERLFVRNSLVAINIVIGICVVVQILDFFDF